MKFLEFLMLLYNHGIFVLVVQIYRGPSQLGHRTILKSNLVFNFY